MIKKFDKYIENKVNECIEKQQKEAEEEAEEEAKKQSEYTFDDFSLPEIDRSKFLAMSIQRTHNDIKPVVPEGATMDSACCNNEKLNKAYNVYNPVEDIIYTHFAAQCFIGFPLCAILTQNWLINKACSLPPKDAIRPNYKLTYKLTDDIIDNEFLEEIKDISDDKTKYNIREIARIFAEKKRQYGQILAFPIVDGANYELPFNIDAITLNSYKGMTVIDPVWYTSELDYEAISNPASINYFRPTYFRMPDGQKIHYSWCLFNLNGEIPDVLKPTYYWGGYPIPQLIYKRVYAAEKTANEAPMLAMTKRLLVTDINVAAAVANPRETQQKIDTLINYRDNFGVVTKRPNENIQQIDTSLSDLDTVIMTQYQLVAAAANVPASKLIETQPKGFNSNGEYEDDQYKMLLTSIQEDDFAPLMEMHYMLLCKSKYGLTRYFTVKFEEIDTPTAKERAEINEIQARTDSSLVQAGVLSPDEVRQRLISDENSGYNGIDEELDEPLDLETEEEEKDNNGNGGYFTKERLKDTEGNGETQQSPFSLDEPDDWFTSNGSHIPIENGETKNEAFNNKVSTRQEYKSFNSGESVNNHFYNDKDYQQWENNLSKDECQALSDYTYQRYSSINEYLRYDTTECEINKLQREIEAIDSAINKYELKEPIKVHRVVDADLFVEFKNNPEKLKNTIYSDKAFSSTSVVKQADDKLKTNLIMNIKAGKGKGAYINKLSYYENKEYEFLLKRNGEFLITDAYIKNGIMNIEMESTD